ncbi:ATP-dependent DNA ligase [Aeromicrobium sp. Marseille-Q0843]|uniref:DNA ligase n=1 Tax=Aeromicrobium phoceense TaxID=2754045 RepID=A0A838XGD4_9ACTN|nr:ATP-dependent DNA ligase [Aeromicrobium phoceense]MBA4608031.1 ATP-dependent DNA ligase [Aeromicrobium phoceense]
MLLAELVATSTEVAATRSRKAKVALLAELLGRVEPDELEVVVSYLGGALRQRRTGLGWRGVSAPTPPADQPSLDVLEVDAAFEAMSRLSGSGSQRDRREAVADLFARATAAEQAWLRAIVTGNLRQGALDAVTQEAVAQVAGVPVAAVRRAAMLAGSTVAAASAAFEGEEALAAIGLEVGRPVMPMLASSAPDVATAMAGLSPDGRTDVAIDAKLDGIRIQVHRDGDAVLVVTRSLDDITDRLPEVVAVARSLPATRFVLDGEALALSDDGRPMAFQDTASRTAQAAGVAITPHFFDVLHVDGRDLLDSPGHERTAALDALVPEAHRVRRLVTSDAAAADAFAAETVAAGHEGVVLKDLSAPYAAGRRGAAWVKVKPVHTLDLVVLAVEWGSGRRQGWLSNIHLGARDESSPTGFVMLGKTFKGMTDAMLTWQTERFLALETHREGHVVHVRPEQVVEIAFDGLQRSTRYPGGLALRFARVVRYRDDKAPHEADTIDAVRALAGA